MFYSSSVTLQIVIDWGPGKCCGAIVQLDIVCHKADCAIGAAHYRVVIRNHELNSILAFIQLDRSDLYFLEKSQKFHLILDFLPVDADSCCIFAAGCHIHGVHFNREIGNQLRCSCFRGIDDEAQGVAPFVLIGNIIAVACRQLGICGIIIYKYRSDRSGILYYAVHTLYAAGITEILLIRVEFSILSVEDICLYTLMLPVGIEAGIGLQLNATVEVGFFTTVCLGKPAFEIIILAFGIVFRRRNVFVGQELVGIDNTVFIRRSV